MDNPDVPVGFLDAVSNQGVVLEVGKQVVSTIENECGAIGGGSLKLFCEDSA